MAIGEIIVRQSEIPAHSPFAAPRIARDEAALRVVITHGQNGVAAVELVVPNWHRSATRVLNFFRMETLVNPNPENKWVARSEASL